MKYLGVIILLTTALCGHGYPNKNPTADEDSDMYLEPDHQESNPDPTHHQQPPESREASQQTFYPSFSPYQNPPSGHSRPFYYQPETAYSQRPQSGYQQQQVAYDSPRYTGYKDDGYRSAANSDAQGILGSGNFGVIRGGTFYDNEGGESNNNNNNNNNDNSNNNDNYERDFSSYFRNGHGRPSFYFGGIPNPKPYQHEQFENFRDFADINTPTNPAYSQYVVVYVNKNSTHPARTSVRPKNIIESLALLDLESETAEVDAEPETETPQKKVSKSKEKLAKVAPEKKWKIKKSSDKSLKKVSRELHEPLLALS